MISVEKLIGNVRTRFKEIFRPDRRWDEWRSFYNGWVEGRTDLIMEMNETGHDAYEFHNLETGHCYVDYIDAEGMGEADGYTKTRLYRIEK